MKNYSGFEFDLSASHLNYTIFKNIDDKNTFKMISDEIRKALTAKLLNNL
jgi:hypothetical protein